MIHFVRQVPLALVAALLLTAAGAIAADPTTADCLSANDKSIALRNGRKLLAARSQLLVCAAATCPTDIRKECTRRIDQVNASMPTIVFDAKDAAGNDLTNVMVKMDGEVLAEHLEGMAISLDPGAHTFTFEVTGQPPLTKQMVIGEGQKDRREVIQLGPTATPTGTAAATPPPAMTPTGGASPNIAAMTLAARMSSPPTGDVPAESHGMGAQKAVALGAIGVGVVGVAISTIFGLQSMSKHNDAQSACPNVCSDANGAQLWKDARSSGNVSTVGAIIGVVGLGTGTILWLTSKPTGAQAVKVGLGTGPGYLEVGGTW